MTKIYIYRNDNFFCLNYIIFIITNIKIKFFSLIIELFISSNDF